MSEYEFIPITYPNPVVDTTIPPANQKIYDLTTEVSPTIGLPVIASVPPPPRTPDLPVEIPQNGVLVDPAGTLTYHPPTIATATDVAPGSVISLPPLVTHMGGEALYASYTTINDTEIWSQYPATSIVDMSSFGMTGVGNIDMATGSKLNNVAELNLANGDIRGCSYLQIDGQILTADATDLLLNGVPIATIDNLPNIEDWALYPALSTIVMNAAGVSGQPFGITGSKYYGFANSSILTCSGTPSTATLFLDGSAIAGAGYTGVSQWAKYPAVQNVDFSGKEITNINKITFNTAVPGLGGASINALNDITYSYATALAGLAGMTNVNNIAWWNPDYPGVPGFYINQYTKKLTYNGVTSAYLATDTKLSIPSLFLGGVGGLAGGKLEVLGANARVATINGNPCSASWSEYPCTAVSVDMNGHQILNCRQIDFKNDNPAPLFNLLSINAAGNLTTGGLELLATERWATKPASENVNMAQHNLINVPTITFANPANSLTTNGANQLLYNGQVIQTGAGNIANWANYTAVNNVVIPKEYALSINAENGLTIYKNSQLNTNIFHGTAGNSSSPNFTSYPTEFNVYGARKISLNTTSAVPPSGIGLNSATTINIDCVGILSLIAGGNVNLEGLTTAFDIGAWNVLCGNWSVEAGALEWATGAVVWNSAAGFEFVAEALTAFNAPLINFLGGAVNFQGGLVTITAGGLAVLGGGVSVAAGGVSIAGGGLQVGGGVANLNAGASVGGTLTAPTIAGVATLTGAGAGADLNTIKSLTGAGTGAILNNIAQVRGNGAGMSLEGVTSINGYRIDELIFSPETYTLGYTAVVVGGTNGVLLSFPPIIWNFNSPKTNVSVTTNGSADVGTATAIGISISFIWAGGSTQTIACDPSRPALAPLLPLGGNKYTCSFNDELATQPPYGVPVTLQINALATNVITTGGTCVVSIFPSQ
jgi:hypothetical protein